MLRKNKIIMFLFPLLMGTFVTTSCSSSNKLLLLNWGEYINDDLVLAFEKELIAKKDKTSHFVEEALQK